MAKKIRPVMTIRPSKKGAKDVKRIEIEPGDHIKIAVPDQPDSYDQGYADGVSRGSSALYEAMQRQECLLEENERLRMELSSVKGQRDRIRRSLRDLMDRLSE